MIRSNGVLVALLSMALCLLCACGDDGSNVSLQGGSDAGDNADTSGESDASEDTGGDQDTGGGEDTGEPDVPVTPPIDEPVPWGYSNSISAAAGDMRSDNYRMVFSIGSANQSAPAASSTNYQMVSSDAAQYGGNP